MLFRSSSEGKRAGEYYPPRSVVRLLVEMLEPYHGRIYDPCCGSGGMFVQSAEFVNAHGDRVRELKERIAAREPNLREQLQQGDPTPLEFDGNNPIELADWFPMQETDDTKVEEVEVDGRKLYSIQVGESGQCVASWRRKVLLAKGRYRIEAKLRTESVEPREDEPGTGAGLRISGGKRDNKLTGESDWQTVSYEFEVLEEVRDVILVTELRATRGRMWIEPVSQIVRVEP